MGSHSNPSMQVGRMASPEPFKTVSIKPLLLASRFWASIRTSNKSINKSIETQQQIDLANQDITNQQQLIDNATEVLTLLKHKYTNG